MAVRVLWLTKGLGPGGAERLLVEHAAATGSDAGVEFQAAYLLPWKQHLAPELEALGVRTHCFGVRSEADPRWLRRLRALVRDERIAVVHGHSPVSSSLARARLRRVPRRPAFVYTEHNRWPSHHRATRVLNNVTFGLNDAAFAVSEEVRDSISARHRGRVETLVHGIDIERARTALADREQVRRELEVPDDAVLAVTIANLRDNKGYPVLLGAAKQLLDQHTTVRFAAVGQGPLEAELEAERERLGLGSGFRFLGYRSDARRVLAGADVFVLASNHEGLPVAVMEALALGVPVVATRVGGLPEMIDDTNGILVPAGDVGALAAAIAAMQDPERRSRVSVGAASSAERFSSAAAADLLNARYRSLARARPR